MKRGYKFYLGCLIGITGMLIYILLRGESGRNGVDPLGWILLGTAVYTEVMQMFFDEDVTMSLSGPMTILAIATQPFWFVVVMIAAFTSAGKLFQKYYYHEQERFFDIKWLFNLTQFIFIAGLVKFFFGDVDSTSMMGMLQWVMASCMYTGVNILLMGFMITLYQGHNGFSVYYSRSALLFLYFHMAITILMIYVHAVGGLLGTVLVFLVLIPMQGEILQRASIHKLNPMLIQDELTGAFNRGFMQRKVTEWLHHQTEFAVLFMDLDGFKNINDSYGHVIGDQILIHFVEQIQQDLRKGDRVVRYGGDEFCILFQSPEEARRVHLRWKEIWLQYELAEGDEIRYTFSSGILEYEDAEEMTFFEFMDRVDRQMYEEKRKKAKQQDPQIS